MAQPVHPDPGLTGASASTLFHDETGYFRSPEAAAAYALAASGGQGFTTPGREARRMLASNHPHYVAMARTWLAERGLPEVGDAEPPDWQNWFSAWLAQNPGPEAAMEIARALPEAPVQAGQRTEPGDLLGRLHAVPDLPPAPPKKVVVQVAPGRQA